MSGDPGVEKEIAGLVRKLKAILMEYPGDVPEQFLYWKGRVEDIEQEIHSYGLLVNWEIVADKTDHQKRGAVVKIRQPKKRVTPNDEMLYDEWFLRVNGITNDFYNDKGKKK